MSRFLVLSLSEGDHSAGMEAWMDWFQQHPNAIIDKGGPFTHRTSLGDAASSAVGFMMIEAENLAAARAIVASSPAAAEGQDLEILQVMDMPA